jgi:hypothetical protein
MGPKLLTSGIDLGGEHRETKDGPAMPSLEFPGSTGSAIPFMLPRSVIAIRRNLWAGSGFLVRKTWPI